MVFIDSLREVAVSCATRPADHELPRQLWRGVLAGAVTVVDVFTSRERRSAVARRTARGVPLTARQATVLHAIAAGRSNKELECELGLRASTVSTHVTLLLTKLGMSSRADVARCYSCLLQLTG